MQKPFRLIAISILAIIILACSLNLPGDLGSKGSPAAQPTTTPNPTATLSAPAGTPGEQPALITGTFKYTNDFVLETYYSEHAVGLLDMTGFVKRDDEWVLPVNSQVLGYMNVDTKNKSGTFHLALPQIPEGELNDVGNKKQNDKGVQIFTVGYAPNMVGSPFAVGDDETRGWPTYLASVVTDTENQNEVIGGKLVIWAPDDKQTFPTGFGTDGKLFTADDPTGPVPAGYSIIDLDQSPFGIIRSSEVTMTLTEPKDVGIKDFSKQSYSDAFNSMFNLIKVQYAFNGIKEKQPDWDALYQQIFPLVQAAETKKDPNAYFDALAKFTYAFKDGHVGLSGDLARTYFRSQAGYGYGFAIRELNDGRSIVTYILDGGPAQKAGIKKGAELVQVNGTSTKDAIGKVQPVLSTYSTDTAKRIDQAIYLLHGPQGSKASFTFKNPGGQPQTVDMTSVQELQSLQAAFSGAADQDLLPLNYSILNSEIGYIRISSNDDDLGLIMRLFDRALNTFQKNQVLGVIFDLRQNAGGSPLGLAGYLTKQTILEGQLQYYSDKTSKFESVGTPDKFFPMATQYQFNKMVLLVGNTCYSACELEAYGFSKVPGMKVVGQYPTGGVEAEVARGQFDLPEGISMQIPTGRFINPDGSLFLEGTGVVPQTVVPVSEANVLSGNDVTLQTAEDLITKGN